MDGTEGVLDNYRADVQAAYADYALAVQRAGRTGSGKLSPAAVISGSLRQELEPSDDSFRE